jgi:sugar lactone lactonase YvrE
MKLIYPILFATFALGACSAQTITAFAGTGDYGFSGDDGSARFAQFASPGSLANDGAGGLYIMDGDNWRIRRVSANGAITTIAGTGDVNSPSEGAASQSGFISLYDIAIHPNGFLYIADADGLQKVDQSGRLSFVVTGSSVPRVAISNMGTIYLADATTVSRLESDGSTTPLAGTDQGDSGDGGPATLAQFFVNALAVDRIGNLFIVDQDSGRVRKIAPNGLISTLAGTGVAAFGGDGGPANTAMLNAPTGIAVDVAGNVYIADTANKRIRKVTTDGNISTFAGQIDSLDPGDDGPALQAYLDDPSNLAISCSALYVNDSNRIRAIALSAPLIAQTGIVSTVTSLTTLKAGGLFSISGCNLASTTLTADPTFSLPTILGAATVTVNGVAVPLMSVSPSQIVAQLPATVPAGTATVVVTVNGKGTATDNVSVN